MSNILTILATKRKAVAAFLAPLAVAALARWGFNIDVNTATVLIGSLITAVAVHEAPNKVAE